MRRVIRPFVFWLLALALPLQGLAAATMLHCVPAADTARHDAAHKLAQQADAMVALHRAHQATPVVHHASPVVHQASSVVHQASSVVHQAAPAVYQAAPVVQQAAPAAHPVHDAHVAHAGAHADADAPEARADAHATAHGDGPAQGHKCSACAACSVGLALPSAGHTLPGPVVTPLAAPAPCCGHAAFFTSGPERPPRGRA